MREGRKNCHGWQWTRFRLVNFRPNEILRRFDIGGQEWDKQNVKTVKPVAEKKTPGTLIVEKYRPRLNKRTPAQRQQLRNRAMQIAFGHESESAPTPRG